MHAITEKEYMEKGRQYLSELLHLNSTDQISAQSHDILVPGSVFGEGGEDRLFEVRFILRKLGEIPAEKQKEQELQEWADKNAAKVEKAEAKAAKIVKDTAKRKTAARKKTAEDLAAMMKK